MFVFFLAFSGTASPDIVLPLLRLKMQVVYTTHESTVTQWCGEEYAKAFLGNLMLTEEFFQNRLEIQSASIK